MTVVSKGSGGGEGRVEMENTYKSVIDGSLHIEELIRRRLVMKL